MELWSQGIQAAVYGICNKRTGMAMNQTKPNTRLKDIYFYLGTMKKVPGAYFTSKTFQKSSKQI